MSPPKNLVESMEAVLRHLEAEGAIAIGDRESAAALLGRALGAALWGLWKRIDALPQDLIPSRATGEALDAWASSFSLSRQTSTYAAGAVTVSATDPEHSSAITIPSGTRFLGPLGQGYATSEDETIGVGQSTVVVRVTAEETGGASNLAVATPVFLATPITGVETAAVVGPDPIAGGTDAESDDALRERVLYALQWPRGPFTVAAIEQICRAAHPSIRKVWARDVSPGYGHLYLDTGNGYWRWPSASAKDAADSAVQAAKPPGLSISVGIVFSQAIDLRVSVPGLTDAAAKKAILDSVTEHLGALGPGEVVRVTHLSAAIVSVARTARLLSPTADVTLDEWYVPQIGAVTWETGA